MTLSGSRDKRGRWQDAGLLVLGMEGGARESRKAGSLQKLEKARNRSSPGNLQKEHSPAGTLILFYFKFIYLFLATLGLCCCARAFSSCGEWRLLFVVVHGLLIAVASLVEPRLQMRGLGSCGSWALEHRLNSCGTWAWLLHGMWDPPGPGLEPMSSALAGGFLTTVPQGKSPH